MYQPGHSGHHVPSGAFPIRHPTTVVFGAGDGTWVSDDCVPYALGFEDMVR